MPFSLFSSSFYCWAHGWTIIITMDALDILFHPLSNKLRRPISLPFYSAKIFEVGFKVFYTIVFGDLHTNSLQLNGRIITFKYAENGPVLAISNINLQIIFFREMIQQHVLCYGSISMTRNKAYHQENSMINHWFYSN